jgi:hypothetical protein
MGIEWCFGTFVPSRHGRVRQANWRCAKHPGMLHPGLLRSKRTFRIDADLPLCATRSVRRVSGLLETPMAPPTSAPRVSSALRKVGVPGAVDDRTNRASSTGKRLRRGRGLYEVARDRSVRSTTNRNRQSTVSSYRGNPRYRPTTSRLEPGTRSLALWRRGLR